MGERRITADGRILEMQPDGSVVVVNGGPQGQVFDLPPDAQTVRDNRREDTKDYYDRQDRGFDNTKKFRDEFRNLPSVSEFNIALGTFNAAQNTQPTPEGDQSLITAFARMMDPNSVVREGEFATAAGNESAFQQIKARIAKEFGLSGAGRLTDHGRARLREEMRNLVVNRFQAPYERDRQQYSRYAQIEGIDPYLVVGEPATKAFDPQLLAPPTVQENLTVSTDGQKAQQLPQEYQDAHYAYLRQNWGNLDPQAYTQFRSELDQRYGQTPNPQAYAAFVPGANQVAAEGGSPADLGAVPSPNVDAGFFERQFAKGYTPEGAFIANSANALAAGLPARLSGNQNRLEDIRDINPGASFAGEVVGGIGGATAFGAGGQALGRGIAAGTRFAPALTSPTATNVAYGATYGATQDDNPYRGAALGGTAAFGGEILGKAAGKVFPDLLNPRGYRAASDAVPTIDELTANASDLYKQAEAAGSTASPAQVDKAIEQAAALLRKEGFLSPKDRIRGTGAIADGMNFLNDFSGMPMTPTQVGAVRKAIGEGRTAMKDGAPDLSSRRVAGKMLDQFDNWAAPALPGVEDARAVAQRAILGREMERANELAIGPKASQFSQSGEENALRNIYRGIDTAEIKGRNAYPPELVDQIQTVSRGTPFANAMRTLGKFAPNSAVSAIPAALASLGGASAIGPAGLAAGGLVAGAGIFGRKAATALTRRAAKEAELIARGGPEYQALRDEAARMAEIYGGRIGAGAFAPLGSITTR